MPSINTKKWITEEDQYEDNHLDNDIKEQAKNELREDPFARKQALHQLRDWLKKHPRIVSCRLDSNFLLRFLRAKKFSLPLSQEALERYILLRQSRADEFSKLDCKAIDIKELFDTGFLFPTPNVDHLGRRIVIVRPGQIDPYRFTKFNLCRAISTFGETMLENEEVQIRGLVYYTDGAGVSMPFITLCTPRDAVRLVKNGERTVPIRHKKIIGFNVPTPMKFVFDFGIGLVSEKIRNRVTICNSIEETYGHIDKKLLPKEYGGTMPIADMLALWRKEMECAREKILSHDYMEVNLSLYSEKEREGAVSALKQQLGVCSDIAINKDSTVYGLSGSFRKLEVD